MSRRRKCIGCWFSTKKKKKVNLEKLRLIVENHGACLKEIDMSRSMKSQGPFDAIIHKMTDRMIEAMNGNKRAEKNMKDIENYLGSRPNIVVVDPLLSIQKLLDRFETYKLIRSTKLCRSGKLNIPTFAYITSKDESHIMERMREHKVEFPFVCKKSVAHGSASHKMSIIFNKEGLKDVDPPCVAQTFINHGALLYKIYVIADKYHVVQRPSLRNFSKESLKDHKTIFFNSHDISSGDSSRSKLTTKRFNRKRLNGIPAKPLIFMPDDIGGDHSTINALCNGRDLWKQNFVRFEKPEIEDVATAPPLDKSAVEAMTKELHSELNMTMYGVDIIASIETGKQYIIDVNVFPGYDGVPDFLDTLVEHVMGRLDTANSNGVSSPKRESRRSIKNSLSTKDNGQQHNCKNDNDEPLVKITKRESISNRAKT